MYLKTKKNDNMVNVKINILALKTNLDSIILFTRFGISGSFINTSQLLDNNKAIDIPNKIRLVKTQRIDMFFCLLIKIFALFAIKIAAAGVAGSQ